MPAFAAVVPIAGAVAKQAAKVPVVGGVVSDAVSFFGKSDPKEDAKRLKGTDEMFTRAVAGDVIAIAWVRARGAKVPPVTLPGHGKVGNWPGDTARNYARKKYLQLEAMPSLATKVAEAKRFWSDQGLPTNPVTERLAAPVGNTGIPLWLIIAGVAAIAVTALIWWRSR